MAKHTPGSWVADTTTTAEHGTVWTKADYEAPAGRWPAPIADCSDMLEHRRPVVEWQANARLIAAAPDLLKALKEACDVLSLAVSYGLYDEGSLGEADILDTRAMARAAIAKAEGGAS